MPPRGRYGRPCNQCRFSKSKKRCIPSDDGSPACKKCREDGIECTWRENRSSTARPQEATTYEPPYDDERRLQCSGFGAYVAPEQHDYLLVAALLAGCLRLPNLLSPSLFHSELQNAAYDDRFRSRYYSRFLHSALLFSALSPLPAPGLQGQLLAIEWIVEHFFIEYSVLFPLPISLWVPSLMGMMLSASAIFATDRGNGKLLWETLHALLSFALDRRDLQAQDNFDLLVLNSILHSDDLFNGWASYRKRSGCSLCSSPAPRTPFAAPHPADVTYGAFHPHAIPTQQQGQFQMGLPPVPGFDAHSSLIHSIPATQPGEWSFP